MAWEYLRFFHLIFVSLFIAGIALAIYGSLKAVKTTDPDRFEEHLRLSMMAGMLLSLALVVVSILGVLTAWQQGYRLTSTGWLIASYVSVFVVLVLAFSVDKPNSEKALALMPQARKQGQVLPEQVRLLNGPLAQANGMVQTALLIFLVVLMVFKPF